MGMGEVGRNEEDGKLREDMEAGSGGGMKRDGQDNIYILPYT